MSKLAELDAGIWRALDKGGPLPIEAASIAPAPDMVRAVRMAAGLTQKACGELFGYSLRAWQHKEETGAGSRALSIGEWNYFLLIAEIHPEYVLKPRRK